MGNKNIVLATMSLCFAIAALLFATSQNFDSKSINLLLNSTLNFETANYFDNLDSSEFMIDNKLLNDNLEISSRNYMCSVALVYKDTINPDPIWKTRLAEECINLSSNNDSVSITEIINSKNQLKNLSNSLSPNPIKYNLDNLQKVQTYQTYSRWSQVGAWIFMILGFLLFCFYLFLERN